MVTQSEEKDNLINYLITLLNIKVASESEKKELQVQMIVILDFIKSKFGFLTIPEIREAFKMYVAKDFGHKDIFRQLDTIVVSDVLNCFMNFKSDSLRAYGIKKQTLLESSKNEISPEEKEKKAIEGINRVFQEFKETKLLPEPSFWIFDDLVERGLIKLASPETPKLKKYYDDKTTQARKQLLSENKKTVCKSKTESDKIKVEYQEIMDLKSVKIEIRVKRNVLIEFFKTKINEGKEIIIEWNQ